MVFVELLEQLIDERIITAIKAEHRQRAAKLLLSDGPIFVPIEKPKGINDPREPPEQCLPQSVYRHRLESDSSLAHILADREALVLRFKLDLASASDLQCRIELNVAPLSELGMQLLVINLRTNSSEAHV